MPRVDKPSVAVTRELAVLCAMNVSLLLQVPDDRKCALRSQEPGGGDCRRGYICCSARGGTSSQAAGAAEEACALFRRCLQAVLRSLNAPQPSCALAGLTPCARRAAGREVRYYLQTAHGCLRLIRLSTMEITAPWLTQEMAHRIASTLNYFLLHLTGALGVCHTATAATPMQCGCMPSLCSSELMH